jgi:SWI/SNF-related matrix-associated actin-dependent regulator 1 of chromatin subfamily A
MYSYRQMYYTKTPSCYKVEFPYHPMLVKCIRRIPSAKFNGEGKFWTVSGLDKWYLEKMAEWAVRCQFVNKVQWSDDTGDTITDYTIPPMPKLTVPHNMKLEPYEYQKEGIAYALEKKRCIMGDEPGLGKTAQAIGTMTASGAWPALVICPASLKENWRREFKKFGGVNAIILTDDNKDTWQLFWKAKNMKGENMAKVFITNYESLKKFFVLRIKQQQRFTLKSIEFDKRIDLFKSVIIDESHKCKSSRTQQSKFVQGIAKGKEYVLELTGTPVVNNNEDLIQQLNILGRMEDFGGYRKFVERYCAGESKSSHIKELNYYLNKYCFFRRQKKDVLKWLPEKTRVTLVTDIDNRKEYNTAKADVIKYLRDWKKADDDKVQRALRGAVMVKMGILKQISAKGKTQAAIEFIHNTIDGGEKLIVFCFLKQVVQELKEAFPKAVTVTGDDNDVQKQHSVDSFQNDPKCKLIILNYRSGGTGLTLTAASNVLFVEFPWTYADCCQAEDRAHRNGQKNAVTCTYLLGKDTIDEYMYNLINTKKDIANGVTGTEDNVKVSTQQMVLDAAMDLFGKEI